MTRYLSLSEVLRLHARIIASSGGGDGIQDWGALESALSQPRASFGGSDLYSGLFDKAAALCLSLSLNHPFVDGNKRIAHAAMEVFMIVNGFEMNCSVDESERMMLDLAAGELVRERLVTWIRERATAVSD